MDYLATKLEQLSVRDIPLFRPQPSSAVPNASLSSRDIFSLYSKGVEVPHLQHLREEACFSGYVPTDPLEALQLAHETVRRAVDVPPAESTPPPSAESTPPPPAD